ncbi:unnamed protein product [Amoebophrya sp. A120]|nr:unnamed protein product [Amoebophrya sp. A120]|eukprot:GSA120T00019673001.1
MMLSLDHLLLPRRMSAAVSPSASAFRWKWCCRQLFLLSFLTTRFCHAVEGSEESPEPVGETAKSSHDANAAPANPPSTTNIKQQPKSLSQKFTAKLNYITERYPHVAPFSSAKEQWLRGDPAPFRCPGVPKAATFKAKLLHAKCRLTMDIEVDGESEAEQPSAGEEEGPDKRSAGGSSCAKVAQEIIARVRGEKNKEKKKWQDPHNGGKYAVADEELPIVNVFDLGSKSKKVLKKLGAKPPPTKDKPWIIRVQRMTNMKDPAGEPLPAEKQYTDKVSLVLVDGGSSPGKCKVFGCSESQVFSMLDGSTNYCNLRNLVCGAADGCPFVHHSFAKVTSNPDGKDQRCTQHDNAMCNTGPAALQLPKAPAEEEAVEAKDSGGEKAEEDVDANADHGDVQDEQGRDGTKTEENADADEPQPEVQDEQDEKVDEAEAPGAPSGETAAEDADEAMDSVAKEVDAGKPEKKSSKKEKDKAKDKDKDKTKDKDNEIKVKEKDTAKDKDKDNKAKDKDKDIKAKDKDKSKDSRKSSKSKKPMSSRTTTIEGKKPAEDADAGADEPAPEVKEQKEDEAQAVAASGEQGAEDATDAKDSAAKDDVGNTAAKDDVGNTAAKEDAGKPEKKSKKDKDRAKVDKDKNDKEKDSDIKAKDNDIKAKEKDKAKDRKSSKPKKPTSSSTLEVFDDGSSSHFYPPEPDGLADEEVETHDNGETSARQPPEAVRLKGKDREEDGNLEFLDKR